MIALRRKLTGSVRPAMPAATASSEPSSRTVAHGGARRRAPRSAGVSSSARPSRAAVVAAFAAIYVFWGGTYLAIRYAVADVPPLLTIAVRCAGGAAILYAWLAWRGQLQRATAAQWRTAAVAGLLLFLVCHGGAAWAEQRMSSGQAALFSTAIPLWMVVLTACRERRLPPARVLAGLALGVLGVAVLSLSAGQSAGSVADRLVIVVGSLGWAAGSLVALHGARPASAAQSTAMQLAAGAVVLVAASVVVGEPTGWSPSHFTPRALGALAFLVVCGTVLGFGAYTWLLQVTSPALVSTYTFVNPVIALVLAWAVGDERFTVRAALAALLIVGAVALTRAGPRADARRAGRSTEGTP